MTDDTISLDTPKKKTKLSFQRQLHEAGVEVYPVVERQKDPTRALKRKRGHQHPLEKQTKRKKLAAGKAPEPGPTSAESPVVSPNAFSVDFPTTLPVLKGSLVALPYSVLCSAEDISQNEILTNASTLPPKEARNKQDEVTIEGEKIVSHPVDPLGLFDEFEGPFAWPSGGLWD